jgi:hypothetical protein
MLSDHNDKKLGPFTFSWNGISHFLFSIENSDEYGAKINLFTPLFLLECRTPRWMTVKPGHEYGIRITDTSAGFIRQTCPWEDNGASWLYPWKNLHTIRSETYPLERQFKIRDYDGAIITATTKVREDEYRWGPKRGFWRIIGLIKGNKVNRWMQINFSAEVGPEKGSWKGGMTGHSIDIDPSESMEVAMRRYCDQEQSHKGRKYKLELLR